MRVAAVDGVVGRPDQPFRLSAAAYRARLAGALSRSPELLLCHGVPRGQGKRFPGCPVVAAELAREAPGRPHPLVVAGHKHWDRPLFRDPSTGGQCLNVDGRVVVLVTA